MRENAYYLSGWCFASTIFQADFLKQKAIMPLEYVRQGIQCLDTLVDQLAVSIKPSSSLIGWSFGGLLAILLAYRYPHLVKNIVFIASQPRFKADINWAGIDVQHAKQFVNQAYTNFTELQRQFLQLVAYPCRDKSVRQCLLKSSYEGYENECKVLLIQFLDLDLRDIYGQLNCQILHIINDRDAVITQDPQLLVSLNAGVTCHIVNGAGHAGFLTHTGEYQQVINEFITQ